MKLLHLNPVTPGTRHQLNLTTNLLAKSSIIKTLSLKLKKNVGRSSNTGHITTRHKGGGCKKKFRKIRFNNFITKSIVLMIAYDPYRNSFISLNFDFSAKLFFYSIATQALFPGTITLCQSMPVELYFGNRASINYFSIGSLVSGVCHGRFKNELAKYSRAAGTYCQIIQKKKKKVQIRLPSGKFILLSKHSFATFGRVSNIKYNLRIVGKAGRNRLKGVRPTVRGIAMNPVDHPHGGRTNGGRPSVSPWGKLTKGKKTKKKNE